MVKPAMSYLDVLRAVAETADVPVAAYQVSGEYAMVEAAAANGWLDRDRTILETLTAIRRAGADLVLTYWAARGRPSAGLTRSTSRLRMAAGQGRRSGLTFRPMTSPSDPYGQQQGYGPPPGYGQPPQQGGYPQQGLPSSRRPATASSPRPGTAAAAARLRPAAPARVRPTAPAVRPAAAYGAPPQQYGAPQQPYGAPQQGTPAPEAPGLVLAEWWERLVGRFIDGILFGVVYFILGAIFAAIFVSQIVYNPNTGEFTGGGLFVLAVVLPPLIGGLLYAGYDVFMHGRDGQTLGKKVMKTRIVTVNGGRPDQATLMKRAAIYPGIIAIAGLLGFISIFGGLLDLRSSSASSRWWTASSCSPTRCGGRRCTTSGRGTIVVKAQPAKSLIRAGRTRSGPPEP